MTDFRNSWAQTRRHLRNAADLLPSPTKENEDGSVERFEDWMAHNELELALDELEGLGEVNSCPPRFWRELLSAAQNMGLQMHATRYEAKQDLMEG